MEYTDVIRALVSLCATLSLLLVAAWAWKRFGTGFKLPTSAPSRLTVLETKRLTPQTTLHLIKLDGTEHLLSVTPTQTTLLQTTPSKKKS